MSNKAARRLDNKFQSTPSARRATRLMLLVFRAVTLFQSTPSARRATYGRPWQSSTITFQSTPSARRATNTKMLKHGIPEISIHALREEGDFHG